MKSKTAAGLLGIFFGELGIHWFYLGKTGRGVAHLLIFLLLWWTIFVPIIQVIIVLIEGIMILCMSDEQFNAQYNNPIPSPVPSPTPQVSSTQPTAAPSLPSTNVSKSTKSESLLALKELLDKGILSQEEFDAEKRKILNS